MSSLVLELQAQAADGMAPLADVLRRARMIAVKLQANAVAEWISHELEGYPAGVDVPEYRVLHGNLKAVNPVTGRIIPIVFEDNRVPELVGAFHCRQSLGVVESIRQGEAGFAQAPLSSYELGVLADAGITFPIWSQPFRYINLQQIQNILEAVRNRILEWALELESKGIKGEGMTFSPDDKVKAASVTNISVGTIGQFSGQLGVAAGSLVVGGDFTAVDAELKRLGFSEQERGEIRQIVSDYQNAPAESRLASMKRGLAWIVRHGERLGALYTVLKDIFA